MACRLVLLEHAPGVCVGTALSRSRPGPHSTDHVCATVTRCFVSWPRRETAQVFVLCAPARVLFGRCSNSLVSKLCKSKGRYGVRVRRKKGVVLPPRLCS